MPLPKGYGSPKPFRAKPKPEGYETGRPTLYRPEYCQRAIEFMNEGYSVTALAGELGVSKNAVYEWMAAHREFGDAVNIGRAGRVRALERKLLTTKIGVGVTAAIFGLKNADPDEWQDRYNSTTNVNVRIEHVSDDDLLRIVGQSRTIEHDPTPIPQQTNER